MKSLWGYDDQNNFHHFGTLKKKLVSSINGARKTGYSYTKECNWTPVLHLSPKLT